MTYIKINDTLYPATISGKLSDAEWNNRASKAITLEMTYEEAAALFVDGLKWSIVQREEVSAYYDKDGELIGTETQDTEFDNGDYDVAGSITDNRDGTITVKMGKITDGEALAELMEALK